MQHRFGDVEIDEAVGEVRVRGQVRPVEPQVLAVLSCLIRERHRVVHKDELLDEVWGSRHVSASAVTSRIKSARQAVGDTGREQRVIRTVHGRGYRFVAELDGAPGHQPSAPRKEAPRDQLTTRGLDEGWPLVARDAELVSVLSNIDRGHAGGVLLTGAPGLGKSRLARAALEAAAHRGAPVARINGHTEASTVPLAAFAHLLPDDVVEIAGLQGEMARSVLFQRARRAVAELAPDRRLVLMVDDIDRVDRLSVALIGSLIADGTLFALMTQRVTGDEPLVMEHLIRSGRIRHLPLGPLPADQLVALLARVLDGPVDPTCADALVGAADGNPGMLRQLLESSTASGAVARQYGFWSLVGRLTPPADMEAAIRARLDDLDRQHREALELVAIAGDLDLDVAFDLVDDEVLDALELEGMITVRQVGSTVRIRLAHPLFGEVLLDQLSTLRLRRHRAALADAVGDRPVTDPADRLQLVRLRLDSDGPIDDELLLQSATLALIEGDTALALRLANRVGRGGDAGPGTTARAKHLRGEALYLRGRFAEAGAELRAIDLGLLDDLAAAYVLRRITTWTFFGRWRQTEALEELASNFERYTGAARDVLESYWTLVAAYDGRHAEEASARAAALAERADGVALLESKCGAAMADLVRGRRLQALDRLADFRRGLAGLPPDLRWSAPNYASSVEVLVQLQLGDPAAGRAVLDRDFGAGTPPSFRFVAFAAGRLALAAGEYQQVFDWLDPHIEIAEALGIQTNSAQMQTSTALAALALGDDARAAAEGAALRALLPDEPTVARFELLWAVLQIESQLGADPTAGAQLVEAASAAALTGNLYCEELLLSAAVFCGAAGAAVDRLGELAAVADGELTRLRHRSALAVLGDDDAAEVIADLRRRGLLHDAQRLQRAVDGA